MCLLILTGCYSMQALSGGAGILARRTSVATVLAREDLSPDERHKLELSQQIVSFAINEMKLPDNGSYRAFVRIDRPYVVWNVVAAPELSVQPLHWCFPFAGCVSYRGYFKEKKALKFARQLEMQGNDVAISGADAYSTLGLFKDPVLSTFLNRREVDLAGLLFHELAHQQLYVKDDTTFNESFATVVEREGVRRWLEASDRGNEIAGLSRDRELEESFVALLSDGRERLETLYGSDMTDEQKVDEKERLFAALRGEYEQAKRDWGGDARYDSWFDRPLNNARLAAVFDYSALVPPLEQLLRQSGGDMETFYERAEQLGQLEPEERRRQLDELRF